MRSIFFAATFASVLGLSALSPAADVGVIPKLADLATMKPVPAAAFVPRPFEVETLQAGAPALRSNWVMPGQKERYGHAVALIEAPIATVRSQVTAFGSYKDLVPSKFNTARVVRKKAPETDLYVQVPLKIGGIVLWGVTRWQAPHPVEGTDEGGGEVEVLEGRLLTGNFAQFHLVWTMKAVDDKRTALSCDMLLGLDVPAPQSAVDEELRDACGQGVDAVIEKAKLALAKAPEAKK
jgi:CxxC motif-containing protein